MAELAYEQNGKILKSFKPTDLSNWLRLLQVVNTRTCMLEFTLANLEK